MHATVRLTVRKDVHVTAPEFLTAGPVGMATNTGQWYVTDGVGPDLTDAARDAVRRMIDYLGREHGLSAPDAYMLCSVTCDLKISEIVDARTGSSRPTARSRSSSSPMDQPNFRLDGQVALVTGASRGIGHDLVLALAGAGATVAAGARRSAEVEDLVTEVEAAGGRGMAVELDVTKQASIDAAVRRITDEAGQIDVLVNNAGLGFNHDAVDITEADWDAMMDVNLKGLFFVTQAVARGMIDRRYGRIVSLSSQASLVGIPRHAIYSASKGGLNQLTRVLALEWSPFGVTVNAVAPTFIRTPGTAERLDDPTFAADALSRIPVGRFGTTADVAAAVLYLASPAAGLVTGTVLSVDGGWTSQ